MKRAALLLCCSLFALSLTATAQSSDNGIDGNGLLYRCQIAITGYDHPETLTQPGHSVDALNAGRCLGFIEASSHWIRTVSNDLTSRSIAPAVCLPENASNVQLMRVTVKWLTDHPEHLHEHEINIEVDALRDAFPCPDSVTTAKGGAK